MPAPMRLVYLSSFAVALLAVVAVSGCAGVPVAHEPAAEAASAPRSAEAHPAPRYVEAALERSLLAATNAVRAESGLPPLEPDSTLAYMARGHSEDMARRQYFGHASPEGRLPTHRAREVGYSYRRLGENLYRGALYARASYTRRADRSTYRYEWRTPDEVAQAAVAAWLASPAHRDALLADHFTHADFGVAVRDLNVYVTLNLSEPRVSRWRESLASGDDRSQPTSADPRATRRSANS